MYISDWFFHSCIKNAHATAGNNSIARDSEFSFYNYLTISSFHSQLFDKICFVSKVVAIVCSPCV